MPSNTGPILSIHVAAIDAVESTDNVQFESQPHTNAGTECTGADDMGSIAKMVLQRIYLRMYAVDQSRSPDRVYTEQPLRGACTLLNKICPENKALIIKLFTQIRIDSVDLLRMFVGLVTTSAVRHPPFCQIYADLVHTWDGVCPQFQPKDGNAPPMTCRGMLRDALQNRFGNLMYLSTKGESNRTIKQSALTIMKFIGYLLIRKLLCTGTCRRMIRDLLYIPSELMVECALALITTTGSRFANRRILNRLNVCKTLETEEGEALLSKRVQFMIEDLKDERGKRGMDIKTVALIAVQQDGDNLQYASNNLKAKEDVVLAAVMQKCNSIQYASNGIQNRAMDIVKRWQCTITQAVRSMNEPNIVHVSACGLNHDEITCRSMDGNVVAIIPMDITFSAMGLCRRISHNLGIPVLRVILDSVRLDDAGSDEPICGLLKRSAIVA